jgi:hypothetical protein
MQMNKARPALPCPVLNMIPEDMRFCMDAMEVIVVKDEAKPAIPVAYAPIAIKAERYTSTMLRSVG